MKKICYTLQKREGLIMENLDVSDKIVIGQSLVNILRLKEDKSENYNPKRYITAWGNKTALGIYETVKRIMED